MQALEAGNVIPGPPDTQNSLNVHLVLQGINKVVRWPGATQEQLDRLLRMEVTSGSAKGFD
jgi:hypothetical protein